MLMNKNYPPSECAKDMQTGLAHFGGTGDAAVDASLAKGNMIMLPCPACAFAFEGRKLHMLTVQKRDGRFTVGA
jgi:hypothetical protein